MFGQLSETYKCIFSSCCQKQLGTLQKFPENFIVGWVEFVLATLGILCSLIISGKLHRLKEISLLPKNLGTLEKS